MVVMRASGVFFFMENTSIKPHFLLSMLWPAVMKHGFIVNKILEAPINTIMARRGPGSYFASRNLIIFIHY